MSHDEDFYKISFEELTQDYEELQDLLIQRDNEINALKHMLDRKDEEK